MTDARLGHCPTSLASEHRCVRGSDERSGHDGRTISKLSPLATWCVMPFPWQRDVTNPCASVGPPPRWLFRVPIAPLQSEPRFWQSETPAGIGNGDGGDITMAQADSPSQHPSPSAEQPGSSSASSSRPVRAKRPSQALRDSSPIAQQPVPPPALGPALPPFPSPTSRSITPSPRRTHECTEPGCHRIFARAEHLNRHMRVHTQEKRNFFFLSETALGHENG
jgi:hypothetical protein